jgi:hypothetical protein
MVTLNNLDSWVASEEKASFVVVRGQVSDVGSRPSSTGNRLVEITSDDISQDPMTITTWVSQDIPVDFGIDSIVYVIGRPYKGKDGIKMDVYGILSPKDERTSPVEMPQMADIQSVVWDNL